MADKDTGARNRSRVRMPAAHPTAPPVRTASPERAAEVESRYRQPMLRCSGVL